MASFPSEQLSKKHYPAILFIYNNKKYVVFSGATKHET